MTISLKQGVVFSDGTPLTADDVVWTLNVRKDYGTDGLIGSPTSIEKIDDYTVVITWAEFSLNFEMWILPQYIYCKAAFESNGLDWMLTNMMGSGPYILKEYMPDVHLLFTRNPNYWRDETPIPMNSSGSSSPTRPPRWSPSSTARSPRSARWIPCRSR